MGLGSVERSVMLVSFQAEADSLGSRLHMKGKTKPLVAGVILLAIVVFAVVAWSSCSAGGFSVERAAAVDDVSDGSLFSGMEAVDMSVSTEPGADSDEADDALGEQVQMLFIHVGGAVCAPGLYELPEGSRAAAAIEAAGGFAAGAASDAVNLAQELSDGEQVIVPTEEEYASGRAFGNSGSSTGVGTSGSSTASGLVNINTATVAELDTLPGIGESTAQKIVADRSANGPFKAVEDLKRVSGIGDKKYEQLAALICV